MKKESETNNCTKCMICGELPKYIRHTQFAGSHPYCERHAKEQDDFGEEDSSYFFWEKLDD